MKLLVGLGNPGEEYSLTRHNIGFMAIEHISARMKAGKAEDACRSIVRKGSLRGESVVLAMPQTYMNLSGRAVSSLLSRFSLTKDDLTVIHDDIDVPLGKVKEKNSGGSAGHNGIASIMETLGSGDFRRIRLGVGRPPRGVDPASYVLSPFEEGEKDIVAEMLDECYVRAINLV